MKAQVTSHFAAAVAGGLVVAGSFLALGVAGRRTTRTVVQQSPVAVQSASAAGAGSALTPHAIYVHDAPGVVFVKALVVQQVEDPFDLLPQRVQGTATGSGFLVSSSGLILTNYHVIQGADRSTGVTVQFEDQVTRRAVVVSEDQDDDLALLRVDMAGVLRTDPLPLGDSSTVRVGDPTLAIGNPFGLDRTLTSGIVSALQRQIQAPNGFSVDNVIQTDAPINPGNSGGPLLDAAGRVIGINSQIETAGNGAGGSVGIAFAVPIDTAEQFLPTMCGCRRSSSAASPHLKTRASP
jgi:S1-C subfamily serine protease